MPSRNMCTLVIVIMFFIITVLSALSAHAGEQQRYVGVPVFYSKFVPKSVDCEFDRKGVQGTCGITNYPDTGTIGITSVEVKPKAEAVQVRLYMEVVCTNGFCTSPYGEKAGTLKRQETSYWTVPTGFYLYEHDGKVTAYKAGNGPLAKDYPIRDVWILPEYDDLPDGYYIPEAETRMNFNVHCNPANDCIYMGKELTYSQLQKYVPKRMSTQCDVRFCYDTKNLIVGLNPKYQ